MKTIKHFLEQRLAELSDAHRTVLETVKQRRRELEVAKNDRSQGTPPEGSYFAGPGYRTRRVETAEVHLEVAQRREREAAEGVERARSALALATKTADRLSHFDKALAEADAIDSAATALLANAIGELAACASSLGELADAVAQAWGELPNEVRAELNPARFVWRLAPGETAADRVRAVAGLVEKLASDSGTPTPSFGATAKAVRRAS
jgi:hypothetical protein